jgi:hypothetical protein
MLLLQRVDTTESELITKSSGFRETKLIF